jgi:hypothetical protein
MNRCVFCMDFFDGLIVHPALKSIRRVSAEDFNIVASEYLLVPESFERNRRLTMALFP